MKIELEGKIVIIDEAHNIAQAAEDALTFEVSTKQLHRIEYELLYLLSKINVELLASEFERDFPEHVANLKEQNKGADAAAESSLKSNSEIVTVLLKVIYKFRVFIDNVDYKQLNQEGAGFGKYQPGLTNDKYFNDLLARCWVLNGDGVKPFFDQFKLGTGHAGAEHKVFKGRFGKLFKEMDKMVLDLTKLQKGGPVLFQIWLDMFDHVYGSLSKDRDAK